MPNTSSDRDECYSNEHKRAYKRQRVGGEFQLNEEAETSARRDDVGPSGQSREPEWEPRHKIFLSHSGVQKAFTENLCEKLEAVGHFPFFDKRDDSLRKGEKFFSPLMKAARECRVAVLVLSDEFFTKSKWPMMELNEFVKVQESENNRSKPEHEQLRIFPLFFKITRNEFNEKREGKDWETVWKALKGKDDSIDLGKWRHAVSMIQSNNGIEYGGENEGESAFIKRVVEAVCKLVRPELEWDVSHVQSKDELCGPILKQLRNVKAVDEYKAGVVGLYGMGGVGKTTISRAVCNELYGEFGGKVCHVELGRKDPLEWLRTVLRKLTEASPAILGNEHGELVRALKKRMKRQKVFLVLDNVWDHAIDIEEVQMYLAAGYHDGSMVLVTCRSRDVLVQRLHIPECDCMEMPTLEEKGATNLFLQHTGRSGESFKASDEWTVIQSCVEECRFIKQERADPPKRSGQSYHYHPLALKVLGSQLGSMSCEMGKWAESLEKLTNNKFNMLEEKVHPVHSVLRLGYDALQEGQQHIFLDLALFRVSSMRSDKVRFEWKWLCDLHERREDVMKESVKALQRKGILEDFIEVNEEVIINIHDLYLEFAEAEARAGPFEKRRFLVDKEGSNGPRELQKHPPNGLYWPSLVRVIIHKSRARSLKNLLYCKNVEVLELRSCRELEEVDVRGMDNLRCMVISGCEQIGKWTGLEGLENLIILQCIGVRIVPEFVHALSSLTALLVLELKDSDWSQVDLFPPDLSRCKNLRELILSGRPHKIPDEAGVGDFGKCVPVSLTKLDLTWCPKFLGRSPMNSMRSLTNLQDLNLSWCEWIEDLRGLSELILLKKLNVRKCSISNVHELRNLKHLEFLDVSWCERLRRLTGIGHATALRHVEASWCVSLEELAAEDFMNLEQLEFLDVRSCRRLRSIVGIAHATSLRHLDASFCLELSELPDDFSKLEKLEVLDLGFSCSICTLPNDYGRLAEYLGRKKVNVWGCSGLVLPLVKKLNQGVAVLHEKCGDSCTCGRESMQSWIDTRKNVDGAAYLWLDNILSGEDLSWRYDWRYMLDTYEEVTGVLLRAVCEHVDRDGWRGVIPVLYKSFPGFNLGSQRWAVVATAPCTLSVVTAEAILQPRRKTLLHYSIVDIFLPFVLYLEHYLDNRRRRRLRNDDSEGDDDIEGDDDSEGDFSSWYDDEVDSVMALLDEGILAVLIKCKEKLEDASKLGIDPVRSIEGKKVVDTFRGEIEIKSARDEEIDEGSVLCLDRRVYINNNTRFTSYHGVDSYTKIFPNFPSEEVFVGESEDDDEYENEIVEIDEVFSVGSPGASN